jgi:hypothetical protein
VASAALNERDEQWMQWFRTESDKGETPQERILNMFMVLKAGLSLKASGLCLYQHGRKRGDPDDPVRQIAKMHLQKLLDYALELCGQLNTERPDVLARQLLILVEGRSPRHM